MSIEPAIQLARRSERALRSASPASRPTTRRSTPPRAGLPVHDVKVVTVGYSLLPALLSHTVDAVLGVYRNVEGIELQRRGLHADRHPARPRRCPHLRRARPRRELRPAALEQGLRRHRREVRGHVPPGLRGRQGASRALARDPEQGDRREAFFLAASTPATLELLGDGCLRKPAWAAFGAWMHERGLLKNPRPRAGCDDDPLPRVALRAVARAPARCAPRARRTHSRPRGSILGRASRPAADRRDRPFRFPLPGR